jgi:protein LSM14
LEEFDFVSMNQKFDKDKVFEELKAQTTPGQPAAAPTAPSPVKPAGPTPDDEQDEEPEGDESAGMAYNPKKSFFDDISCEAKEVSEGKKTSRPDRSVMAEQRQRDTETFGDVRGYRGPRGRGYRGGRGRGPRPGGPQNANQAPAGNSAPQGNRGGGNRGGPRPNQPQQQQQQQQQFRPATPPANKVQASA